MMGVFFGGKKTLFNISRYKETKEPCRSKDVDWSFWLGSNPGRNDDFSAVFTHTALWNTCLNYLFSGPKEMIISIELKSHFKCFRSFFSPFVFDVWKHLFFFTVVKIVQARRVFVSNNEHNYSLHDSWNLVFKTLMWTCVNLLTLAIIANLCCHGDRRNTSCLYVKNWHHKHILLLIWTSSCWSVVASCSG